VVSLRQLPQIVAINTLLLRSKSLEGSENFPQSMVPSMKPGIIKRTLTKRNQSNISATNLIVDIAANRCLFRTIEFKLLCFNKTPKWKYFSQNSLIASFE